MTVLLRTEGVYKSYGGVQALDTCTIQIDEGTVAGLIGPNGSGKTTLFNVITGYRALVDLDRARVQGLDAAVGLVHALSPK